MKAPQITTTVTKPISGAILVLACLIFLHQFTVAATTSASELLSKLSTGTEQEKIAAAARLKWSKDKVIVPGLIRALNDPNENVRANVVRALYETRLNHPQFDGYCGDMAPVLAQFSPIKNEDYVYELFIICGKDSVNPLQNALKHQSERIRARAVLALSRIGAKAQITKPVIRAFLDNSSGQDHLEIAMAIALVSPQEEAPMPVLLEALSHDQRRQVDLLYVLGGMGSTARPAIPRIKGIMRSGDKAVYKAASTALLKIDEAGQHRAATVEKTIRSVKWLMAYGIWLGLVGSVILGLLKLYRSSGPNIRFVIMLPVLICAGLAITSLKTLPLSVEGYTFVESLIKIPRVTGAIIFYPDPFALFIFIGIIFVWLLSILLALLSKPSNGSGNP